MGNGTKMIFMRMGNEQSLYVFPIIFKKRSVGKPQFHTGKIVIQKIVAGVDHNNAVVYNIGIHIHTDFFRTAESDKMDTGPVKTGNGFKFFLHRRRFPGPADFRQGKQFQLGFGVFTHKFLLFLFIKYVSGINFRQMAGFLQQQQAVVVNTPENAAFYFFFRRHRNFGSEPPGVMQP